MKHITTQEQFISIGDLHIFVKQWLPEKINSSVPVILLHDSLGSVGLWKDFPQVLANSLDRRVIAYDRLGFGKSSPKHTLPSFDFIKEEAEVYFPAIKAELGINEYLILGHSVGGAMAVNIAAHDLQCKGLITIAAQAFVEVLTLDGIQSAKQVFAQPEQIKRLEKWHGEKAPWVLQTWTDTWLAPEFLTWNLDYCLKDVSCPVLVMHGELDEYGSSAFPRYITENVSGAAQCLIFDECGHIPHREKPSEVLYGIEEFLLNQQL